MHIDVYDFDGTIYDGDSTVDFVRFCLRRHPSLLAGLPGLTPRALALLAGREGLTQFKAALFGRMAGRIDLATEAGLFWLDPGHRRGWASGLQRRRATCPSSSLRPRRNLNCATPRGCWAWSTSSARAAIRRRAN